MNLTHEGKVYFWLLLASGFFAIAAVTFGFFPYLGMSLSFIFFSLVAYKVKKKKTKKTNIFLGVTILLSLALAIRSEEFLTFLNLLGSFFFGSLMVLADNKNLWKSIVSLVTSPITLLTKSLFTRNEYHLEFKNNNIKKATLETVLQNTATILLTAAILLVIVPLLASVNPFFEQITQNFLDLFSLERISFTETFFQWLLRFIAFLLLAIFVPKIASLINKPVEFPHLDSPLTSLLIPKIAVITVLGVFFITQFQLYFSTPQTLQTLGYSYSQYTREVFAQLLAVATIIILLLFNDRGKRKIDRVTTYLLLTSGFFLTFMAFKSDVEYIGAWGYTYIRLYGLTVATWILGVFILFTYMYRRGLKRSWFTYSSVVLAGALLVLVNVLNFDYLIYHGKKSATGSGIDYQYLSQLSADSLSYNDQVDSFKKFSQPKQNTIEFVNTRPWYVEQLLYKIDKLKIKYEKLDIRSFNFYEYLQYRQIKDVDTATLRSELHIPNL